MMCLRRRRVPISTAFLVVAVVVSGSACGAPPGVRDDPGKGALEAVVRDYVGALNANDLPRVAAVTGQTPADLTRRLAAHGGRGLVDVALTLTSDFPHVYRCVIQATGADGTTFSWQEVVEWTGDRWHFAALP